MKKSLVIIALVLATTSAAFAQDMPQGDAATKRAHTETEIKATEHIQPAVKCVENLTVKHAQAGTTDTIIMAHALHTPKCRELAWEHVVWMSRNYLNNTALCHDPALSKRMMEAILLETARKRLEAFDKDRLAKGLMPREGLKTDLR